MNAKTSPDRIVTTAFGKSAKRKECRFIKGEFYKMNEECFKFEGRWYRINSGYLVQDVVTGKHILKEGANIVYGLALNSSGEPIIGHFLRNEYKNVSVSYAAIPRELTKGIEVRSGTIFAYDEAVVKQLGLVEDIPTGIFMKKTDASKKIAIGGSYPFRIDYSFENSGEEIKEAFRKHYNNRAPKSLNEELLHGLSFGWEFETTDGFIHPRHLVKTGLIPLRDGSISGYEFVTCPISGSKGLDVTIEAAKIMKKYTTNNISCSLHLHLGNIPINDKFITDFYKVCYSIQSDIFNMFPKAMERTSKYKGRDYCNRLPALGGGGLENFNIERMVNWATGRSNYYREAFRGVGRANHPDDRDNNRKWAIQQRYCFVNVIPYLFSKRGTVEFRIHTPTTNPAKLINWLFICAGIVNFVRYHAPAYTNKSLENLTLNNILRVVYSKKPGILDYLLSYVKWRKDFMKQCANSGDDIGSTEIMSDLDFTFPFKGTKETLVSNGST
jgi:hypothetical protein